MTHEDKRCAGWLPCCVFALCFPFHPASRLPVMSRSISTLGSCSCLSDLSFFISVVLCWVIMLV